MQRLTKLFIVALCLSIFACSGKKEEAFIDKLKLTKLDGTPLTSQDLEGKTVFVNFWATWCGPCLKEMPSIERAKNELEEEGYVFLAVSNEEMNKIQTFEQKQSYTFTFAQSGLEPEALNIYSLPASYIINAQGEEVFKHIGAKEWDSADNLATFRSYLKP
ncbi:TlpA family protein disulfide reductase [Roseivirga pacifica]|uniref:TlpA family protein disulfide reductase n=1 Tax=Roseivirga pacifica TaxID=1267423 RepID=UPI002095C8D2|nr:TlpA disulfide reductase family protein [Roseivirga pacifica]MCO6360049.1 redoxin domain-containing protein [Roseivirga pacifica]MCO6367419.1 redoxin domain-containing protein [Roseivirga pacifica]MCO6370050.1 redoxin domain-containing protein [Roseivirga pacifica]MCO6375076.1 redoxin domain-containing protein [Roseivirga pacifica]MCO6380334.1 redoxin domain-containing protein [Roseivirga pacifica]